MADISTDWDIEGILTPQESVEAMLRVIPTKTLEHSGTFWTWEGKVRCRQGQAGLLHLDHYASMTLSILGQYVGTQISFGEKK